jgi:hypothetical protein
MIAPLIVCALIKEVAERVMSIHALVREESKVRLADRGSGASAPPRLNQLRPTDSATWANNVGRDLLAHRYQNGITVLSVFSPVPHKAQKLRNVELPSKIF